MKNLGRRDLLKTAMAGMALAYTPALARDVVFVPGTGKTPPAGLSPLLLNRAKAALDLHKGRVRNRELLAIADFSKASRDPRFHLVNLQNGQLSTFLVAHGKGSDPGHSGWVQSFSNTPGSEATSSGSYLVGQAYIGEHGTSRRLAGLDAQNDQAEARAIVIHPAWYVSQTMVAEQGKIGRSQGCFAFSENDIGQILERLAPGTLLYADKV